MGEWILKLLAVAFVCWILWHFLQPHYLFTIRIRDGHPSLRKGTVTGRFLVAVEDMCRENNIVTGWVAGVMKGRRVVLRFSGSIPPALQQRLRNDWQLVG
jgi:hypothetical protein